MELFGLRLEAIEQGRKYKDEQRVRRMKPINALPRLFTMEDLRHVRPDASRKTLEEYIRVWLQNGKAIEGKKAGTWVKI